MAAKKTGSTTVKTTATKKAAAPKKATTVKKTATKRTCKKPSSEKVNVTPVEVVKEETVKEEPVTTTTPVKKAAVKVEEPKKEEIVHKKSVKDYEDIINWKKGEAHAMDWLYIEVNANDLLTEVEAGVDNLDTTCQAIMNCMLEGDVFVVEPTGANKVSPALSVRYYCDNLSEDRKKYFER